jgi:ureidoacrylate peracid hydrolase
VQTIWEKPVFDSLTELVEPARTAMVVVDMQNDFCHPDGYYGRLGIDLADIEAAVSATADLVARAREAGVLVIWVQQTLLPAARADSPSWLRRRTRGTLAPEWTLDGEWGQELVAPLAPLAGEPAIKKHRSSAFVGTTLDLILRSREIESLVIAGTVTQGCVESTARDAKLHDYYVVLVRDCVATVDRELHEASMRCQSTRYDFADSVEVAAEWLAAGSRA